MTPNDTSDFFVYDRLSGITERLSITTGGAEGNSPAFGGSPGISDDGRFVAFPTNAALVAADTNGGVDIYVRDRIGGPLPQPPVPVLAFNPPSLDFGKITVGATGVPQSATLTNTGEKDATGLAFMDPGSGFAADTAECGNALPAGENCQITVTFTPPVGGYSFAVLRMESGEGATARLNLAGHGDTPPPDSIFEDRFSNPVKF